MQTDDIMLLNDQSKVSCKFTKKLIAILNHAGIAFHLNCFCHMEVIKKTN
jgi:hypothetical protein